jgi:hypothetical protein
MSMRNEPARSKRSESSGPDPIDALIDSAARQMVGGEPSSSLRSAVRDRIEHRRSAWSLLSPARAGVAAAVVIAAVLVGRTLSGPADMPGAPDEARPTIELTSAPDVTETARPTIDVDEVGIRSVRLQADQNRVRLTRRLADEVAAPPQEEESLIPPIAVEPLEPAQIAVGSPITVESSGVMPIEVAPLQLEPLRGIE